MLVEVFDCSEDAGLILCEGDFSKVHDGMNVDDVDGVEMAVVVDGELAATVA